MTYLEFNHQLVLELQLTKQNTLLMYNNLKGAKGYLDHYECDLYMEAVDEFHSLANQTEH
ncbi:hypothetical protein SAMN05421821_101369 [Mucilaginibacter lappiensis]|nr:hypothetical protein SAMN05421821_101369 [Mucilaginibacter lappiensis]